jgi:hypothetical protein
LGYTSSPNQHMRNKGVKFKSNQVMFKGKGEIYGKTLEYKEVKMAELIGGTGRLQS